MQNACYALALIAIWNLWCVNWVFFHSRRLCGWKERPNQKSWLHVNKSHIHHHMRCVNGILTTLKYVYRWMKPTHGSCSGHIELNTWYGSVCASAYCSRPLINGFNVWHGRKCAFHANFIAHYLSYNGLNMNGPDIHFFTVYFFRLLKN